MKSPMPLVHVLLKELGRRCGINTNRDWETVTARVESEGLSFLTITLPRMAKDLEEALSLGRILPTHFFGFKKRAGIPVFTGDFLKLVFNSMDGALHDEPSIDAIFALRQFYLACKKIRLECSDERTNAAFDSFVRTEKELRTADGIRSHDFLMDYRRMASRLWRDLFTAVDHKIYYHEVLPKHGPGSTADGLYGNHKYTNRVWTERLESEFPWIMYGAASWSQHHELSSLSVLSDQSEQPVKVIAVPKTLETPRIIAIEPSYMQYIQQAIMEAFVESIDDDPYGSAFVKFVDTQQVNQKLAREGSLTGLLATLDLSEASDRVSNQLVREMLSPHPHLFRAVDACRSRSADVPNHGVIRLAKFASMGSALTFPMEALVFTTLVFLGIESDVGHPLTRKDIMSYRGKVKLYGDDIIVPTEHVPSVIRVLESNGLRVNYRKSFSTGKFRESCGREYYNGSDVSITRIRSLLPESQTEMESLVSTVALRNHLFEAGFEETVEFLDKWIKRLISFPTIPSNSQGLGRYTHEPLQVRRWNKDLQRGEIRVLMPCAKSPRRSVDGYDALLKVFLKRGQRPFEDPQHLSFSGRPYVVNSKRKWIPVS